MAEHMKSREQERERKPIDEREIEKRQSDLPGETREREHDKKEPMHERK